jgi:glycosyltransferase involved in cell wall biosynthesis
VRHGSPKIAYIGTMNEFDCVIHLIEALALLPGIASTQVVMAGDGSVRRQAQERAAELGIAGSIKWLGWVTDRDALGDLVHTADVCVAPERDSAFNRLASFVKIVEYMSVGAAIVAHRLPQTEELCGDCVSYAESMEPSGLAAAMQALLTDPAAAARLRAAAIARFDERIWWGNIGRPRLVEAYWEVFGIPPDSGGHVVPEFALLAEAS